MRIQKLKRMCEIVNSLASNFEDYKIKGKKGKKVMQADTCLSLKGLEALNVRTH